MTRWLVTGGAGFIGAHVVRALVDSGREAVVVDDLSTGLPERLPPGLPLLRLSVLDGPALIRALVETRPTGVIHLAARTSPTRTCGPPRRSSGTRASPPTTWGVVQAAACSTS